MTSPGSGTLDVAAHRAPGASLPLHAWQRLDWRFLISDLESGEVACADGVDDDLVDALSLVSSVVHRVPADGATDRLAGRCSLVVLGGTGPAELGTVLTWLRPGGWVYAEVRRGHLWARGPRTVRGWQRALRRAGFEQVAAHWHVPTIATSSRIVSLDAPVVVRDVMLRLRGRRFGSALSPAARAAHRLGLLPLLVPQGSVIGRRPEDPR